MTEQHGNHIFAAQQIQQKVLLQRNVSLEQALVTTPDAGLTVLEFNAQTEERYPGSEQHSNEVSSGKGDVDSRTPALANSTRPIHFEITSTH